MNEHLNPIFKEMLNNYFKGGRTEMNKDQKEILAIVMQYVDEPENHKVDENEIVDKIEEIIEQIEVLAWDIDLGYYEETPPDEDDRGCEKYHQKKDDDMEKEAENEIS